MHEYLGGGPADTCRWVPGALWTAGVGPGGSQKEAPALPLPRFPCSEQHPCHEQGRIPATSMAAPTNLSLSVQKPSGISRNNAGSHGRRPGLVLSPPPSPATTST